MELPSEIWRYILSHSILPSGLLVSSDIYGIEMDLYEHRKSVMMEKYKNRIENAVAVDDWESVTFMYHYKDQGFICVTDNVDVIYKAIDKGRIDLAIDLGGPDSTGRKMRIKTVMKYVVNEDMPMIRELIDKSYLDPSTCLVLAISTNRFDMTRFIFDRSLLHITRDTISPRSVVDTHREFVSKAIQLSLIADRTHLLGHIHNLYRRSFAEIYNDYIKSVINEQTHPNISSWVRHTL
jgi:hypothetical protein